MVALSQISCVCNVILYDEDDLILQIIPQSVCSHHGLAIGATMAPFVRVLVWICLPVAWPISKVIKCSLDSFVLGLLVVREVPMSECPAHRVFVLKQSLMHFGLLYIFQLLDFLLGHGHVALFRRAELKTLVDLHGNEACLRFL